MTMPYLSMKLPYMLFLSIALICLSPYFIIYLFMALPYTFVIMFPCMSMALTYLSI